MVKNSKIKSLFLGKASANGEVIPLAWKKAVDPPEMTKKDKIANNKKA